MFNGLRKIFSPAPAPFAGAKDKIPLGEVLKRNWLELWYQPKIELRTMRLVGAEALVRARHPERGILAPFFFLPGAGEDDLHALTEQVILTALGDWEIFDEYGVAMKFAVNVPVSAFVKLPIPRMLREARPRSPAWPGMILEVTEDQIINDLNLANEVAADLRELQLHAGAGRFRRRLFLAGAVAAIAVQRTQDRPRLRDELRHRPAQCRPVRDHRRTRPSALASRPWPRASRPMHESHKLQGIGCDVGQGYLFARPMPKGQLIGLLRQRLKGASPAQKPVHGLGFA